MCKVVHRSPPASPAGWVEAESLAFRVDKVLWEPNKEIGLVDVRVEGTVQLKDASLVSDDLEYSLDFGDYTIGTGNTGTSTRDGQPPRVHALFTVSAGSQPSALLVKAKETTLRIPLR